MTLFFKVNLYFQVHILSVSLVEAQRICNAHAFQVLRPCGNNTKYKELTGSASHGILDFKVAGRYCYAESVKYYNQHFTWEKASTSCRTLGARLAEFRRNEDWSDLQYTNRHATIFDSGDMFWLSGKYVRKKWYWYGDRSNVTEISWGSKKLAWASGEPSWDHTGPTCMHLVRHKWRATYCSRKHHFICQKDFTAAYNKQTELNLYIKTKPASSPFSSGEFVNVLCKARTSGGIKLVIDTPDFGKFTLNARQGPQKLKNISVFNILRDVSYFYGDFRCFRYDRLSLTINMTRRVHESLVTCTHHDTGLAYLKSTFTITVPYRAKVSDVTITPDVEWLDDEYNLAMGDTYKYFCRAYLALSERGSFAITQGENIWATPIYPEGRTKGIGTPVEWFKSLVFESVEGNDVYEGGKYVNLTVSFKFIRPMDGASFGCYAYDITPSLSGDSLILNKTDALSTWIVFALYVRVTKIAAMLEIAKLTDAVIDGNEPITDCQTVHVTCTALGATRNFIKFLIDLGNGKFYEWKFGAPRKITRYATVTDIKAFKDTEYRDSMRLGVTMTVEQAMTKANLECVCINRHSGEIKRDSRKLYLRPLVGILPPTLTPEKPAGSQTEFLRLTCRSQIGDADIQSWQILDNKGKTKFFAVHKERGIIGNTFPWVEVQVMKDPDPCGQVIISKVTMLKLSPKEFGVTFTCYSYDVLSKNPIKSLFNKTELSATYLIFGGGTPKDEKPQETDLLYYLIWFLVLVALAVAGYFCVWFLAPGLIASKTMKPAAMTGKELVPTKARSNVRDDKEEDANNEDKKVEDDANDDTDHGDQKADRKAKRKRDKSKTMSAITGSEFTGASQRGESSKKSYVSGSSFF